MRVLNENQVKKVTGGGTRRRKRRRSSSSGLELETSVSDGGLRA